jgi:hypothetical protein
MSENLIRDIRYYASRIENVDGNSMPGELNDVYNFSNIDTVSIGQRIAKKLKEQLFYSGIYHHIYINFTTLIDDNVFQISSRKPEAWIQYINVGLSISMLDSCTDSEKEDLVYKATFKALYYLYKNSQDKMDIIKNIEKQVISEKSELVIKYLEKRTKKYLIVIDYKIKPNKQKSCFHISYKDNNGKECEYFYDLLFYEDIFYLIDSVVVKNENIELIPKKSYTASLCIEKYSNPIQFKIS